MVIQFVENFAKAMVLVTCGVPAVNHKGKPIRQGDCWEFRGISSEQLKEHGYKTVEEAEEAGFVGKVIYAFGPHEHRKAICKVFDKVFHDRDATSKQPEAIDLSSASGKVKAVELIAMGVALAFKNRNKFAPRRAEVRAKLLLIQDGEVRAIIDRRTPKPLRDRLT